jgi:hypothetical protein
VSRPGVVYTPPDVAERLAREVIDPMIAARGGAIRVIDPACGEGALLAAAARRLAAHGIPAEGRLFGLDVDPAAASVARRWAEVTVADALWTDLPKFDAVLMNPPWIDAEAHARLDPIGRARIRARFRCTRGNWDLFVPFIERAWELTHPGGRTGILLPERAISSDYMAEVHRGWLERHPIACWRLGQAFPTVSVDAIAWIEVDAPPPTSMAFDGRPIELGGLSGLPPGHWGGAGALSDGALRRLATATKLGRVATLSDGASTTEAYQLAEKVTEVSGEGGFRLVNTGTIDPFRTTWGQRPTRYLGRTLHRPGVSAEDLAAFPRRLQQARSQKVLVAGLSRRLEAVAVGGDVLCGKSAVCVVPTVPPDAVAAVLNSGPIDELYRRLFSGHGFGGSLHVGPRQLEHLPFPDDLSALATLGASLARDPDDRIAWRQLNRWMSDWLS